MVVEEILSIIALPIYFPAMNDFIEEYMKENTH